MEAAQEKTTYDNNNKTKSRNQDISNTPEETARRFITMTEEKYNEWLLGCKFIDASRIQRVESLTAADKAKIERILKRRKKKNLLLAGRKQKKGLEPASKQKKKKKKVSTSDKTKTV